MNRKTQIGVIASVACMTLSAFSQTTVSEIVGFQKVAIPPSGSYTFAGFSFTGDQPLYLTDVFGTNQLVKSNRSRTADKIYIWNGSAYDIFFQKSDGVFYDVLTSSPATVQISSGAAMFLQSPDSATATNTVSFFGNVLVTPSEQQSYAMGLRAFANPYPTDLDLNDPSFDWSAATADNRSRNADKIYIWNKTTGTYEIHHLDASRTWQPSPAIIPAGGGAFYDAKAPFNNAIFKTF